MSRLLTCHRSKWPGHEPRPRVSENTAVLICWGWSEECAVEANGADNCSLPQRVEVQLREGPLPCLVKNRSLSGWTGATPNPISVQGSREAPSVNPTQGWSRGGSLGVTSLHGAIMPRHFGRALGPCIWFVGTAQLCCHGVQLLLGPALVWVLWEVVMI